MGHGVGLYPSLCAPRPSKRLPFDKHTIVLMLHVPAHWPIWGTWGLVISPRGDIARFPLERMNEPHFLQKGWVLGGVRWHHRGAGPWAAPRRNEEMQNVDDWELAAMTGQTRKPRPWGWFVAALLAIFGVSFLLAFYLPLQESYGTLLGEHEKLAQKARELDDNLVSTKATLNSTEEKRATLQKAADKTASAVSAGEERAGTLAATLEKELASLVKAKLVRVEAVGADVEVTFEQRRIFLPGGAKVAPYAVRQLCQVAKTLAGDVSLSVGVVAVVADGAENDDWSDAGERAASAGNALRGACEVPAAKLRVSVLPASVGGDEGGLVLRAVASESSDAK